jgi:hypothetical protein
MWCLCLLVIWTTISRTITPVIILQEPQETFFKATLRRLPRFRQTLGLPSALKMEYLLSSEKMIFLHRWWRQFWRCIVDCRRSLGNDLNSTKQRHSTVIYSPSKRYNATNSNNDRARSGHPRVTASRQDRYILGEPMNNRLTRDKQVIRQPRFSFLHLSASHDLLETQYLRLS